MRSLRNTLYACVVSFFLGQLSSAIQQQGPAPASRPGQASPAPAAGDPAVDASQPVISIQVVCDDRPKNDAKKPALCSRTVTREQFEKLMNALNPGGQPVSFNGRRNLAQTYAEYLAFESAARESGMEDTEEFREIMDWMRLKTAADLYRRDLQERFRSPSPEEIEEYYTRHLASFEKVRLLRIFVPRADDFNRRTEEFDQKALETAQDARRRAAQGEDPAVVQRQVYAALGVTSPPPVDLGSWRRADFNPKESDDVFALKPGEVSPVETALQSYVIYKVTARETLTREQARAEIVREISQQKFREAVKTISETAGPKFNEKYFGPGLTINPPTPPPVPTTPPRH